MIDKFLKQLKEKNYAKSTIRDYVWLLKHFRGIEMNKQTINRFQLKIKDLSPGSRRTYLTKLIKYLRQYYPKLEKLIILPQLPKRLPQNIPNQEEVKQILQRPEISTFKGIRDRTMLELFYCSGIRRNELVNLRLRDIDYSKQIVRIIQGKMKKDRIVPLSRKALAWLQLYLTKVRVNLNPHTDYIFLSRHGYQMYVGTPNKILSKYSTNSCHKYRHAYATHLLQNGMKETSLQRLLGHSQITTTQIYTKVTITELMGSYFKHHQRDKWG